ncbi:hypothetical protein [Streptococcus anginosus]|uniref:hypothetical protein n=1 Tax=Streptococcus anginosus TaxID=1328 RepID=UPI001897325B|nr:hypothetical protein [Streptococcus anginosus]MDB8656678.1 hypothetical protein [Streptococcus anginosus]MDX5014968.1 hypothetical protein [Streptococcus anginosus]MDX5019045.1 hypothetical protein [Streptococcus anginosus]
MIRSIFKIIRRFPEQVFLFVFNSSIFAWLWQSGSDIANHIGVTAAWQEHVPAMQNFFGQNSQAIQGFFNHSAVMWLIGSMIIFGVIRFVKGIIKLGLFALIILLGVYLVMQNQEILSSFK